MIRTTNQEFFKLFKNAGFRIHVYLEDFSTPVPANITMVDPDSPVLDFDVPESEGGLLPPGLDAVVNAEISRACSQRSVCQRSFSCTHSSICTMRFIRPEPYRIRTMNVQLTDRESLAMPTYAQKFCVMNQQLSCYNSSTAYDATCQNTNQLS